MGVKKVRGHKKLWKQIDLWEQQNLKLDLEELRYRQRDYAKAAISPYSNYPELDIAYSEPSGKTRQKILNALLNILENWHEQLRQFGEDYYLKLWLYEPFLTKSQVVCATGDFLNFYENSFFKPAAQKSMPVENYGQLRDRMEKISWEYAIHEESVSREDIGEPFEFDSLRDFHRNKNQVNRRIQNHYRATEHRDGSKYYHTKYGRVWLGSYQ